MAHTSLTSLFSDIADAIRAKTGGSAQLVADDFPTAIAAIPSCTIATAEVTGNNNQYIYFSNITAQPKLWVCISTETLDGVSSYEPVEVAVWDGSSVKARVLSYNRQAKYKTTFSQSYSSQNHQLTINANSSSLRFVRLNYLLIYVY